MNSSLITIVTTIQSPTDCMRELAGVLNGVGASLIVVGDKKGPSSYDLEGAELLSLDDQLKSEFRLSDLLPKGHYARKNLGYLMAFGRGACSIYETDDDNAPNSYWGPRKARVEARRVGEHRWVNVYRMFYDQPVWPRGFPLQWIRDERTYEHKCEAKVEMVDAPIQQGLADNAPDVDAIWRLVADHDVYFNRNPSVWLPPGSWCPFNSQSTWWWPVAYPLMYLPSYCSFRMTDIWRSFLSQRCLWAMGFGLVFHAAEVQQNRNIHDLLRDFEQEVPGYLGNDEFVTVLENLELQSASEAAGENLLLCYDALIARGFFPESERQLLSAWLEDVGRLAKFELAKVEEDSTS